MTTEKSFDADSTISSHRVYDNSEWKIGHETDNRSGNLRQRSSALFTTELTSTIGGVPALQSFQLPSSVDATNNWRAINGDAMVESPSLQIQTQFTVNDAIDASSLIQPHSEALTQTDRQKFKSLKSSSSSSSINNRSYRRPYSAARREQELKRQQQHQQNDENGGQTEPSSSHLKSILKQSSGGLSLSEILQQQNLSLDDLLKGKQSALRVLQNTAAPPASQLDADNDELRSTKSSERRLPSTNSALNHMRRGNNNGNELNREREQQQQQRNRISNFETTRKQSEIAMASDNKIVSTNPTTLLSVETASVTSQLQSTAFLLSSLSPSLDTGDELGNSVRRLPSIRGKPIKEVVSAIRPDLNNSNLRKRLPNLKFSPTRNHQQQQQLQQRNVENSNTNSTTTNKNPESDNRLKDNHENDTKKKSNDIIAMKNDEDDNVENPNANPLNETNLSTSKTLTSSTITTTPSSVATTDASTNVSSTTNATFKSSVRDRLAFKSRIRPLQTTSLTSQTTHSTATTSSPAETVPIVINDTMTIEENATMSTSKNNSEKRNAVETTPLYTIITFGPPTPSSPSLHSVSLFDDASSNENVELSLSKRLNETTHEFNLVDLEDENKSKEVTSLEDLFRGNGNVNDAGANNEDESMSSAVDDDVEQDGTEDSDEERMDDEFIHQSTSRSDSMYKIERPTSQKIFGSGSLVNILKKSLSKLDVTERNPSLFTDITTKFIDDKTELLDLLGDRRSGSRLVKVLKQRNMTIDELIEHRKRGSSQLHLAEVFLKREKAPSMPSTVTTDETTTTANAANGEKINGKLNVLTAFKTFPEFDLKSVQSVNPDDIKTDSDGASYFTSIENVQPTIDLPKEGRAMRRPFTIKLATNATPIDHWNNENGVDHNFVDSSSSRITVYASHRTPVQQSALSDVEMPEAFGQMKDDFSMRSHDPVELELSGRGYKRTSVLIENAQVPIGVRSAIVASASIVLISLTIFLIIFFVFRWRQRRRRKICYSDRFQAIRGRLPILNSRDESPSKCSTGPSSLAYCSTRRNSKLNTMDPNSPEVQEYLYDAMRKTHY